MSILAGSLGCATSVSGYVYSTASIGDTFNVTVPVHFNSSGVRHVVATWLLLPKLDLSMANGACTPWNVSYSDCSVSAEWIFTATYHVHDGTTGVNWAGSVFRLDVYRNLYTEVRCSYLSCALVTGPFSSGRLGDVSLTTNLSANSTHTYSLYMQLTLGVSVGEVAYSATFTNVTASASIKSDATTHLLQLSKVVTS